MELEVTRKEAELQSLAAATRVMVQQRAVGSSSWTSTLARSVQLRGELTELRGEKRKKRKKRKKKLPKTSSGYGRPCDHQRQVPAVHVVRERGGAPVPVLRQCGGHSCYACRDVYPQCKLGRRPSRSKRCCSWTVPPPGIGGVGFGLLSNPDRKHTIYELCLPIVRGLGYVYGFSDLLEREVQRDVRVHSSSCGTHRDVVHSPFDWLYHRCHCYCRDHVLFDGRLPWLCGPNVLRACLCRDVVWWSGWCLQFYLGQREADFWKIHDQLFPVS